MDISRVFSQMARDMRLVEMTHANKFDNDIKLMLNQIGWVEQPSVKFYHYAARYCVASVAYPSTEFRNKHSVQGDSIWYQDLAAVVFMDHQPGLLLKILG